MKYFYLKHVLLCLCLIASIKASAYNAYVNGIYYNLSGNEAEVTYGNTKYTGNVSIPNSVTCNGTTYKVTSIGYSAFYLCNGLTSVTIPNSVTSIGGAAFMYCSITSITIPNSVTSIGDYAFQSCSGLTSINIPSSVTSLSDGTFFHCTGLTSVTIPNNITSIGKSAFRSCTGLTSVSIPNSVTSIGSDAFEGCANITSLSLDCENIENWFGGSKNSLKNLSLGNNVKTIGNNAFQNYSGLTSVTIGSGVTSIGDYAFSSCSSLTSFAIPDNVTSIGKNAFYRCSGLNSVGIGSGVTCIGDYAFVGCTGLTSIKVNEGNSKYDSRNNCNAIIETATNTLIQGCQTTIIPSGVTSIGCSAFSGCIGLTSVIIPNSVASIGRGAFSGCNGLTSFTIPNSVTSIGDYAIFGCGSLTSVTIPNSVTSIGDYAFSECRGLTSATIPNSVTTIGDCAFSECSGLTSVTISAGVTSIGRGAFSGCNGLTSITIPNSVTNIGSSAFYGCSGLTSVTIPNSVTNIDYEAFSGCYFTYETFVNNSIVTSDNNWGATLCDEETSDGLMIKDGVVVICRSWAVSVTIPNSVTSIGNSAFLNCSSLTSVTIPNSVTSIGNGAFAYCSSLTSVTIPNSVTSIGNYAFLGCSSLTSVTIPNRVTSIGNYAFADCSSLTSVTLNSSALVSAGRTASSSMNSIFGEQVEAYILGEDIESIDSYAFYNCSSLTTITIPNSVTSIGENALPQTATIITSVGKSLLALWNAGYESIKDKTSGKTFNIPRTSIVSTTASSSTLSIDNYYPEFCYAVNVSDVPRTMEGKELNITGLDPDTQYSLEFLVTLADVTYKPNTVPFTTAPLNLITQQPKVISAGNTVVAANTNLDDAETNVGFEWRRYDWPDEIVSNTGSAYLYEGTMEGYIRNLYTGAFWKYRPYYESNTGNRYYGDWVVFDPTNTSYFEPTVHTYAQIKVHGNSAEVKGYVMRGTDKVTSQGFMYWPNNTSFSLRRKAASIPDDVTVVKATGNVMTATLEDLDYEAAYCYVAFVTTEEDETFFGEVKTFSTDVDPDGLEEIKDESLTPALSKGEGVWFTLDGKKLCKPQRGINIIRYSDGSTKKVLVK